MSSSNRIHNIARHPDVLSVIALVAVTILFLHPFFQPGIPVTHDGQLHIARIAAFTKSLSSGQFPVRWAADLNYGYGSPLFIFYYPLPYLLGSIIHGIGISYVTTFKILLGSAFLLAPLSFYCWMRHLTSARIAMLAALLYGLAPYHFLDLFIRADIGELFSFVWIPFILFGIEKIRNHKILSGFIIVSVSYAFTVLSHNAMALLFCVVIALYMLVRLKDKQSWLAAVFSLLTGLGLSTFFWLPALREQIYTHGDLFISSTYEKNFVTPLQLLWSQWGTGKEVAKIGGLSPQIGPILISAILGSIVFIKRQRSLRWLFLFGICITVLGIFLSLPVSRFVWNHVSVLKKFEFPWRLTALSGFGAATLSVIVFSSVKNNVVSLITIIILIGTSMFFFAAPERTSDSDIVYDTYGHSTEFGAASTRWTAGDPTGPPKQPVELFTAGGTILSYARHDTVHTYTIQNSTNTSVVDNTIYYPGWKLFIDNQEKEIQFQDPNHRGLITFAVPPGRHDIRVTFTETKLRRIANSISLAVGVLSVTVLLLALSPVMLKRLRSRNKHVMATCHGSG